MKRKYLVFLVLSLIFQSLYAQFAPYRKISPELSNPSWLASGDLDGDGDLDLVATNYSQDNFAWYENLDETGEFSQQRVIEGSNRLSNIEVVDIDNDGDLDLLYTSRGDNFVGWSENLDGNGNFGEQQTISYQIQGGETVYSADIDGDGDLDVVSASRYDNKIAWYEHLDGTNDFGPQQVISETALNVTCAVPVDFDEDGDMDIIATLFTGDVLSYSNDGLGNFGSPETIINTIGGPRFVFAEDFDGDNDIDLIVYGFSEGSAYWVENVSGVYGEPEDLLPDASSSELAINIGDIDGDGDLDIIGASDAWGVGLFWIENQGNGNFSSRTTIEGVEISTPDVPIVFDINGDGRGEPVFVAESGDVNASDWIAYFKNPSNSGLIQSDRVLVTSDIGTPREIINVDMDGDGDLDIVAASFFTHSVLWYENRDAVYDFGAPHLIYNEQNDFENTSGHKAIKVADLDNDGDNDVILSTNFFESRVQWLENDGTGTFSADPQFITDYYTYSVVDMEVVDVNNDGAPDLIYVIPNDNEVILKINNGSGSFTQEFTISNTTTSPTLLKTADIDGDNDFDLIVGSSSNDYIEVYENLNGTSNWNNIASITLDQVKDVNVADLDNDGDLEIIALGDEILFWYDNIDGSDDFETGEEIAASSPFSFDIGDMNNDGFKDIVVGEDSYPGLGYFRNEGGTGSFEDVPLEVFNNNSDGSYIQVGDFDLDGDLDISYLEENSSDIGWIPSLLGEPYLLAGNLFLDENENGVKDNDEYNLQDRKLTLNPLNLTTWSDNAGNYSFPANIGTHDLVCLSKEDWFFTTDSTYTVDLDGSVDTVYIDFGMTVSNPVKEAQIDINSSITRCGFEVPFYIDVKNIGNLGIDGIYHIELDELTTFVSSSIPPSTTTDNNLYWNFEDLLPTNSEAISLVLLMPDENFDGEILTFSGDIILTDESGTTYFTDSTTYISAVTCAIDPNDKLVSPSIPDYENYTLFDELLEYTIRFQNTGSDTAINIAVTDIIDPSLDLETFRVVSASHDYNVSLDNNRVLTFNFPNIYLPDSTTNYIASNGYVKYSIKPYSDLVENTSVENYADIFFDFNDAIVTNTTTNIMVSEYPFNIVTQSPACYEDTNGSISIDFPVPNLSYSWDTGQAGNVLEELPSGEYTVTVTNEDGLLAGDITVVLNNPEELELNTSTTGELNNSQNGTATVNVTGGTSPYTYSWNTTPEQTSQTASNLSAGDYTVVITDANNCIQSGMVTVEQTVPTSDIDNELTFIIMPNPGKENVNIFYELPQAADWDLTIHNYLGQVVQYKNSKLENTDNGTIAIDRLHSGIYTVLFQFNDRFITKSLIIIE